jgi:glutamyl-tRNA(Gln) amidotransferase subunit D
VKKSWRRCRALDCRKLRKLALGQTMDLGNVKDLMLTPIAGEITEREQYNGYLIFQGGIPEVEEFIRKFHK